MPKARRAVEAGGAGGGLPPLTQRPVIRTGVYAWALLGVVGLLVVAGIVAARLSVLVIPLVLALFPAAVLAAPAEWLKRHGVPSALAALIVLLTSIALIVGLFAALAPQVAEELEGIGKSARQGIETMDRYLRTGPLGLPPISLGELIDRARNQLGQNGSLGGRALGAVAAVAEGITGLTLALVAVFFYLKDGGKIARWVQSLFPERAREDAAEIGSRAWSTVGGYIRGQLVVALVDAFGIGLGLLILGVPLVLPLAVITFFGGLFPIVGAVAAGTLAVLVALATRGVVVALIVVGIILAVQQLESNVLAPVVVGRATKLHPLGVLAALTAGGLLLGILGAFLGVPVAASIARGVGYLREREGG